MGFGRNPYIAKAQAAEQKALDATDDATRVRAYRDAAHEWGRAAERERPGKQREELERNADRNRALADGEPDPDEAPAESSDEAAPSAGSKLLH